MRQERHRPRYEASLLPPHAITKKALETRPHDPSDQKVCELMLVLRIQMLWLRLLLAIAGARIILKQANVNRLRARSAVGTQTVTRPSQVRGPRGLQIILRAQLFWNRLRLAVVGAQIQLLKSDIAAIWAAEGKRRLAKFMAFVSPPTIDTRKRKS